MDIGICGPRSSPADTPAANHQIPGVGVPVDLRSEDRVRPGGSRPGATRGRQAFNLHAGGCRVLADESDLEGAVLSITVAGDPVAWRGLDVYVKDVSLEVTAGTTALATSVGASGSALVGDRRRGPGAWRGAASRSRTRSRTPGLGPVAPDFATPGGETSSFTLRDLTFAQPLDPQDEVRARSKW